MCLPVIAVTSGEPAGIGPELCLRLLERPFAAHVVVLADRTLLAARSAAAGFSGVFRDWRPGLSPLPGTIDLIHLPIAVPAVSGRLDPANASYVLALLDRALAGCRTGEFLAMVTAPVHKGVINEAGVPFTGHTEYLAEKTATPRVVMMLAGGGGGRREKRGPPKRTERLRSASINASARSHNRATSPSVAPMDLSTSVSCATSVMITP
jgi:4-hydroxythreonine-4-phosphate dehydrogenase